MRFPLLAAGLFAVVTAGQASAQARSVAASAADRGQPTSYFEFQVEKPAESRPGNPRPRYPASLLAHARTGEVLAQFVIDTTGQVDMTTFEVVRTTDAAFSSSVKDVLPAMRFYPAEIGGRKVRELAQQRFVFAAVQ